MRCVHTAALRYVYACIECVLQCVTVCVAECCRVLQSVAECIQQPCDVCIHSYTQDRERERENIHKIEREKEIKHKI